MDFGKIFAVISGIGALKEPCIVEVYSDSAYTVNAFNDHWIDNWQKNGWINSKKQPVENSDLWKLLLQIIKIKKHEVHFYKVKEVIIFYHLKMDKVIEH